MQITQFKKYFSPFLAIAVVCFVLAGITVAFSHQPQKTLGIKTEKHIPNPTSTPIPTEKIQQIHNQTETSVPVITSQPTSAQAHTSQQQTVQLTNVPNPTNTPAPQQNNQVNLSINGSGVGQVTVASGANQCDVLSQALSQGKIQSLNMRYDNSLGTNGVYQINGIGKDNAIWWVYKVNGQSPGQGCSYVKANNNDSVEWSYIGS